MIFNTTNKNTDYVLQSNALLGKEFNLKERIERGGIGSGRLTIEKTSLKLNLEELRFSEIDYGNIELRPQGIIIHYTAKLQRFSWLIPYYRLVIFSTHFFSIHANGNFMQFIKNKQYKDNKKFINTMIDFKNDFMGLQYYDY